MLVVALVAWLVTFVLVVASFRLLRAHAVPAPDPGAGMEPISVIVAAHDEAPRIGALVRSVLAQDHPAFELVVVDDRSHDDTAGAARRAARGDPRLRILRAEARPVGWQGRLFAQGLGARAARGAWLLFLSADQRLVDPTFLRAMVAEYVRCDVAAVSVVGPFVGERWWERWWFHPMLNHPAFWGAILGLQRLRPRATWLIGALGLHRDTYEDLGGADGASACAAGGFDDWGWARACARAGLRTRMVHHPALLDVSNWTDFRTFWHGLARWQAGLFTYRRGGWLVALALGGAVACLLGATASVALALSGGRAPDAAAAIGASAVPVLGIAYCRWRRQPWRFALAFPLVGALLLVSLAGAAWARLRNRVRWREEVMAIVTAAPPACAGPDARRQPRRLRDATERPLHARM